MQDKPNDKLEAIRLIVTDVDGALTDGSITLCSDGSEAKSFNSRDGLGANIWVRLGRHFAIITGRGESEVVRHRAREMRAHKTLFASKGKDKDFLNVCEQIGVEPSEAAFIGDDLTDMPAMRCAGLSVAVGDAAFELKQVCDMVTKAPGGRGALRELIEAALKAQGAWDEALSKYKQ